jgi:alanyl-tRNA synthetase
VVDTFGSTFPELVKSKDHIIEVIQEEEQSFSTMLSRGISYFSELKDEMKESKTVPGDKAFFLYDTLGFPIDLTEQMATEAGFSVDISGFESEMNAQKQRSRDARSSAKLGGATKLELIAEQTSWLANNGISTTDDSYKYEWDLTLSSTINAIFGENGFVPNGESATKGSRVGVILDKSSFYAEAGGQESDIGTISFKHTNSNGIVRFSVCDVQSYGGYLLHIGVVEEGSMQVGQSVSCMVDYDRRRKIAPNHSMTHVLNAALRNVLGDGVDQRGSSCNSERLRFDFSHKSAMSLAELRDVEIWCQKVVADAEPVSSKILRLSEAQKIEGVRAVFGEVYPDPVRVVSVGGDTSVEFCGGTHISNTAEAVAFTIVEESAVAKGIRRITAVTKDEAVEAINAGKHFEVMVTKLESHDPSTLDLDKMAGNLRKDIDGAVMSVAHKAELRARVEIIQKKAADEKKRLLAGRIDNCLNTVREQLLSSVASGKRSLILNVDIGADAKASQKVINVVKELAPHTAFMGVSEEVPGSGGKLIVFTIIPDAMVRGGFRADEWVSATVGPFGGRGGGKPENAQGQVQSCSDISTILSAADVFAKERERIGTA